MPSISHIALDDANLPPPTPEIEQERKVAMFDLLEQNTFVLPTRDGREMPAGPYHVGLSIREKRLVFDVTTEAAEKAAEFHLVTGAISPSGQRLLPDLRKLFRRGQEHAAQPDRNHRHGAARYPQRGQPRPARTTRGQGRDRHRHGAPSVHPDLRPTFRSLNERTASTIGSVLLRS